MALKIKKLKSKKFVLIALGVVAVVCAGGAIFVKTHHSNQTASTTQSQPEASKKAADDSNTASDTPAATSAGKGAAATNGSTASSAAVANPSHPQSATLAKPTGSAYSSSSVKLGDTLESTCQTVPGAQCGVQITLPNGKIVVVKLAAVNENGANIIDWNTKSDVAGATTGTWTVQLYALKDGGYKLGDAYKLTVN